MDRSVVSVRLGICQDSIRFLTVSVARLLCSLMAGTGAEGGHRSCGNAGLCDQTSLHPGSHCEGPRVDDTGRAWMPVPESTRAKTHENTATRTGTLVPTAAFVRTAQTGSRPSVRQLTSRQTCGGAARGTTTQPYKGTGH